MSIVERLDDLNTRIHQLKTTAEELDCTIDELGFDPDDPQSIYEAIKSHDNEIEAKAGHLASDKMVRDLIEDMKADHRQAILNNADQARVGSAKILQFIQPV